MPPTILPTVAMVWAVKSLVVFNASDRAELALFCALVSRFANWSAPVRLALKSCWLAAALDRACSSEVSGAGAVSTLLISDGKVVSELGAVRPAVSDGVMVGSVTGEICGAVSPGESCQFQKRVMSIFSAEAQWPSTASPSTPRVGKAMRSEEHTSELQ